MQRQKLRAKCSKGLTFDGETTTGKEIHSPWRCSDTDDRWNAPRVTRGVLPMSCRAITWNSLEAEASYSVTLQNSRGLSFRLRHITCHTAVRAGRGGDGQRWGEIVRGVKELEARYAFENPNSNPIQLRELLHCRPPLSMAPSITAAGNVGHGLTADFNCKQSSSVGCKTITGL